jgi:hypothetical protein
MIRFLLLSGLVFGVALILIGGVHALADHAVPGRVAVLLPDASCAAPCWQGLRPGHTRPVMLNDWLDHPPAGWHVRPARGRGTPPGFSNWQATLPGAVTFYITVVRIDNPAMDRLRLMEEELRLGDVILALGTPNFIGVERRPGASGEEHWQLRLYYRLHQLIVVAALPLHAVSLTPDVRVEGLVYEAVAWDRPVEALDWPGFGGLQQRMLLQ